MISNGKDCSSTVQHSQTLINQQNSVSLTQQTDSVRNASLIQQECASKDNSNILMHNDTNPNNIEPLI